MKTSARRLRIFRKGRNQIIEIPKEYELEGNEVIVKKEGNRLILVPIKKRKLLSILSQLRPIPDDFPDLDSSLLPLDNIKI